MPFLAPVFGAIAGAFAGASAWVAGLGAFGSALVKIGGSLLLSAASQALMPKAKTSMQDRKVTVREAAAPRDLVYGQVRKGGVIVYITTYAATFTTGIFGNIATRTDTAKNSLNLVVVLAGHQVEQIREIYFDGELAADANGNAVGRYIDGLVVHKRLGTPGQTAFPVNSAEWTAAHRLDGCAAIMLDMYYTADRFPNGIPNISVDIWGKNDILDPRTGLRGYSANPALCVADYMSLQTFSLGAQIGAADGIDTDSLIEAANICDESVATTDGGTERRYTCNGAMTLSETPQNIIEAMLGSMAGSIAWLGGAWRIRAGAYRIPTVELTDNDVRTGGMTLETRASMADSFNAVRGTFISPDNDWQVDDFPAYESDVYLAEDGGEQRWRDIALPFTISASMAQRLARIELEKARRQMTVSLNGKLSAWQVSVGGTAMFSYERWGMSAKPFDVESLTLNLSGDESPELVPNLVLRETSPLIYDWDASEAAIYAAAPRTTLPSAFDVPVTAAIQVTESLYVTRDGTGVKALARVEWLASASPNVAEYVVAASLAGGEWVEQPRTTQNFAEILDIEPGLWSFRVKSVSQLGVSSDWAEVSQEIYGLGAEPVALEEVTLQTAGGLAFIKWPLHSDLDVRIGGAIVIRHTTSLPAVWSGSVSMDIVNGAQTSTALPLKPGAYILRARDAGGRLGPASVVYTSGAQAISFIPVDYLQADPVFSGTQESVVSLGGGLRLDGVTMFDDLGIFDDLGTFDAASGLAASGTYTFAAGLDFGAVAAVRLRSDIEMSVVNLSELFDERPGNFDDWDMFDGVDGGEVDVVMEYRATDDDPTASPIWDEWSRVDNAEINARAVQARAKLTTNDLSFTPLVSRLRLYADEVA